MNSHNIIFTSLCKRTHISRSWQLAPLFSGRQVVIGGYDGNNGLASVEVFPRKVGCNMKYSQYVMIMIKIVMMMMMTVIITTMKNLPTQGWLQDTGSQTGEVKCKRLPPPRFYIPLLFEISPLLLPGNQLVVCGGWDAGWSTLTSCESWRPGQEEWTPFKEMRWVFYFGGDHWSSWWSGDDHHGGGCDHEADW